MQEHPITPDAQGPGAQPDLPATPGASYSANPQPYLNEPPVPPEVTEGIETVLNPDVGATRQPALNPEAYYNTAAVSGPPEQPVPPVGRTHPEFANDQQYIHDTPYPYEPARNDPRAALDRPPDEYTPNIEATAAADEQIHSYVFERHHPNEHGPGAHAWVKLTDLIGRPLLDLENGRKLGTLDNLVLTTDYRFVAGFVTQDATVSPPPVIPARGATIGQDAIVIPAASLQSFEPTSFAGMPLARRLIGMKLITTGGKMVGKVTDVRFDPRSDAAFLQVEDEGNVLQRLMRQATTLPMPAIQTFGQDVLIIGEDAAKQYLGDKL